MQGEAHMGQTNYFKYDPNKYGDNDNTRIIEANTKRTTKKQMLKEQMKQKAIKISKT